jgi:cysteine-rich repeat protein
MTSFIVMALWLLAMAGRAAAICSAGEIVAAETNCRVPDCRLRGTYVVEDGCVLDFSGYDLVLESGARWNVASRSVRVLAKSLVMKAGSFLDARGLAASGTGAQGGSVEIEAQGVLVVETGITRARIDASGNGAGGRIALRAGGPLRIDGRLLATNLTRAAAGGAVQLRSDQGISIGATAEVDVSGGIASSGGGRLEIFAGGDVEVAATLQGNGASGGSLQLRALGDACLGPVLLHGNGDAGSGGAMEVRAGRSLELAGTIRLQGSDRLLGYGGDGGSAVLEARYGVLRVNGNVFAEGAEPNGFGGSIQLVAAGDVIFGKNTTVSVRGNGAQGTGGAIAVKGRYDVSAAGTIDASGGEVGGEVSVESGRNLVLSGTVDARGRADGSVGGTIAMRAGGSEPNWTSGDLRLSGILDAGGGGCASDGCGKGGAVDLAACTLLVEQSGRLFARGGGEGGEIRLLARSALQVDGSISAARSTRSGSDGFLEILYPVMSTPQVRGAVVPTPYWQPHPLCRFEALSDPETPCIFACPVCGDGRREDPEQCDDGNTAGCDGCSPDCLLEPCCTNCNPQLGCSETNPVCTASPTGTATPTVTASASQTATRTAGLFGSPSPTPTASALPLPSSSRTPTASPTTSLAPSPTGTRTATATPTATASSTRTGSPTMTPRSTHDLLLLPVRPVTARVRSGSGPVHKRFPVRVRRLTGGPPESLPVRITNTTDCPEGIVATGIELGAAGSATSAAVARATGRTQRLGVFVLEVQPQFSAALGERAPQRCRIQLVAEVDLSGNQDPTPENNRIIVELDIVEPSDAQPARVHQTAIAMAPPRTVRLKPGAERASTVLSALLRNEDRTDPFGHAVRLLVSDGDCPPGTAGEPGIIPRPGLPPGAVRVPSRSTRAVPVPLDLPRSRLPQSAPGSRYRCFLLLDAEGPDGDVDLSNNTTVVTVDVVVE